MSSAPILEVRDLTVDYQTSRGAARAADRLTFDVHRGEFLGVVGESGCGKSTMLFAVARLLSHPAGITGGSVLFHGENLLTMAERRLNVLRWRDFAVVMQSAMNALNPITTIRAQFSDALIAHGRRSKTENETRCAEVMRLVGIDPVHLGSYPHQLSGGMRQRAMIAMALLFTPDLIIMDEPTSALDVVAQRSLMAQIKELQRQLGFAVLFVTHDMSLVSHFSDRLMVMYAGQIVEVGDTRSAFDRPAHPYSRGLLNAFPSIHGPRVELLGIPGSPPDLAEPGHGCRFAPRCPEVMARCADQEPELYPIAGAHARCLRHEPATAGKELA
ncbi:ABC transporter ATP-binding protein [Dactylosporangium sp. NPDC049140]|uniref:ABC transporter ATP-binding protein n=1 Tax=Dactylosporangium sp. NPDC049140 TaxID=3155647 RepID=UPI0033C076A5